MYAVFNPAFAVWGNVAFGCIVVSAFVAQTMRGVRDWQQARAIPRLQQLYLVKRSLELLTLCLLMLQALLPFQVNTPLLVVQLWCALLALLLDHMTTVWQTAGIRPHTILSQPRVWLLIGLTIALGALMLLPSIL
jgi:hypothetical protein